MTTPASRAKSKENKFAAISGWPVLIGLFTYLIAVVATLITTHPVEELIAVSVVGSILLTLLTLPGFFVVPPNVTRVLVLFGTYRGTVRQEGFYWTNPFTSKKAVSVKAHNVGSDKIKVNDLLGNPIEVGAIVVWEVADTAQALFDVEGYEEYVDVQIEGQNGLAAASRGADQAHKGLGITRDDTCLAQGCPERTHGDTVSLLRARRRTNRACLPSIVCTAGALHVPDAGDLNDRKCAAVVDHREALPNGQLLLFIGEQHQLPRGRRLDLEQTEQRRVEGRSTPVHATG